MKFRAVAIHFSFMMFVSFSYAQQTGEQVKTLDKKLSNGNATITQVLTDTAYMQLHSLTTFREIIKKHAKAEKIKITTKLEPGIAITIKGLITDKAGRAAAAKLVYVYQTSSEGWYSDTAPHILQNEGDRRHARLFGYFITDNNGRFEFETIKPKGYPHSTLPAHIHIEVTLSNDNSLISELLFDDDPRLTGDIRKRAVEEAFIISKNTGTALNPVYSYQISAN